MTGQCRICQRPAVTRGLCHAHYKRWLLGMDLERPLQERQRVTRAEQRKRLRAQGKTRRIVYTLADPRSGEVRYVGCTIQKLDVRLRIHLTNCQREQSPKAAWLRELLTAGLCPLIDAYNDTTFSEQDLIRKLTAEGIALLNVRRGERYRTSPRHAR